MHKNDQMVNFVCIVRRINDQRVSISVAHGFEAVMSVSTILKDLPMASSPTCEPARRRRGPSLDKTALTGRQIAEAALAEFVESGLARSTMDRIARRAQVAKGTLYLYFPSKDALLRGVVEHALQDSAAYRPLRRQKGETVQALLRRSLLPTMEAVEGSERGQLAQLILSEARHVPELARLYKELVFDRWQQYVQDLLQLAVDEGELHTRSVSRSAQLLASPFWMGMVHNGLLAPEPSQQLPIQPLVEHLITNLFAVSAVHNGGIASVQEFTP